MHPFIEQAMQFKHHPAHPELPIQLQGRLLDRVNGAGLSGQQVLHAGALQT